VAVEEDMDGFVPFSVELLIGGRIPPIFIEFSVVKFGNLSKEVSDTFKNEVKNHKNDDSTW
jgi:hypothetical protein